jgi:hypothetical protein
LKVFSLTTLKSFNFLDKVKRTLTCGV